MLNPSDIHTLTQVIASLLATNEPANIELAGKVTGILSAQAHARAAMSAAAKTRSKDGRQGAPRHAYKVELEPLWSQTVFGAKAAAQLANATMAQYGLKRTVTSATVGVTLSRSGHWTALLETDDGVLQLCITKAE